MILKFYKKGQGYYTRMGTALGGALISALGCYSLYSKLGGISAQWLGESTRDWIQSGIPVVVFALLCWAIFKLVNNPRFADFLIATEGEMKKVSWTSKKEIITSTKVVIITVFILAVVLAVVDLGFSELFSWVGVLKVIPK